MTPPNHPRIEAAIEPFAAARDLLMSIPGISRIVAEVFIAETGADMSVFPTAGIGVVVRAFRPDPT